MRSPRAEITGTARSVCSDRLDTRGGAGPSYWPSPAGRLSWCFLTQYGSMARSRLANDVAGGGPQPRSSQPASSSLMTHQHLNGPSHPEDGLCPHSPSAPTTPPGSGPSAPVTPPPHDSRLSPPPPPSPSHHRHAPACVVRVGPRSSPLWVIGDPLVVHSAPMKCYP